MTYFDYDNTNKTSNDHSLFSLNCDIYLQMSFKKTGNLWSKLKAINKLATKLKKLTGACIEIFQHFKKILKQYYVLYAKVKNYISSNKLWLNNKYIKTIKHSSLKLNLLNHFKCYI